VHAPAGGRRHCPLGGMCNASQSSLVAFQGGILSITPPSTRWADACQPPLHDGASTTIFFSSLFSLSSNSRGVGLLYGPLGLMTRVADFED